MSVPIIKNIYMVTKYITFYYISLKCKKKKINKTTIKIIITRNAQVHG